MTTTQTYPELLLLTSKIDSLRQKLNQPVSFSYDVVPLNKQQFQRASLDLYESIRSKNATQKDLESHDGIILGLIEGRQDSQNLKQIVQRVVGEIDQNAFKTYLEQKTQIKNYAANSKDKKYSIRQIKKLQPIQKYFDINEIKKQRKVNNLCKVSLRALKKCVDLFDKMQKQSLQSIMQVYEAYNIHFKQQKKYQAYLKSLQPVTIVVKQLILNDPVEQAVELQGQQHKIIQQKQIGLKKIDEQKPVQTQKTPIKGKRKSSKPKLKKSNQGSQNTQKQDKLAVIQNQKQQQAQIQKDKIKTVNKKKISPAISNNKTITQFFVFKKPATSQLQKTVKKSRVENQEYPENINNIEEYTFNPANLISLPQNVNDKITQNQEVQGKATQIDYNQRKRVQFNSFLTQSLHEKSPIEKLRSQFQGLKMQNQSNKGYEHYFTNLILTLSTIQYFNYYMKQQKQVDFAKPFIKIHEVFYFQDQSEEFEGQSANHSNTFTEQVLDQSDDNSSLKGIKILDDDHLSSEEISEVDSDAADIKVQYGKGAQWSVTSLDQNWPRVQNFVMIALFQDEFPLKITEEPEPLQSISAIIWQKIYQESHGFYGPKQNLIKNISVFAQKVSKNWIDNTLKERTQKVGVQRFIKKQFIEELKQKIPDIEQKLNQIKIVRQKQLHEIKQQKNQQKLQQRNQKLQKDILQSEGSKYIVDLLKYLKEKGHKQLRKKQLEEFISQKQGQQWNAIKIQMNTMSKPIKKIMLKQAEQMRPLYEYNIVQMIPEQAIQGQNQIEKQKNNEEIVLIESDKSYDMQMKQQCKQKQQIKKTIQKQQIKQSSKQTSKSSKTSRRSQQDKQNKKKKVNVPQGSRMDLE